VNADGRRAVVDAARYLREVRPIDPDEIAEYVPGGAHPAVVRQVLREEGFAIGLRERADGTFVPVDPGPLSVDGDGVERFPERYERALADLLVERFGPGWPDGDAGDRLRERLREVKERYYRNRPVRYDEVTALGYAIYHLPDFYAATQYVLADLASFDLLPRRLRVLDVGAGGGGPMLGVHDLVTGSPDAPGADADDAREEDDDTGAIVDYHAIEPSEHNAAVLDRMAGETGRTVRVTTHRTTAEAFDPASIGGTADGSGDDESPGVDLVLFGNVLSELDDPAATVGRYLDALAPDGSVVAVAPADRETAIGLREIERAVERERDATVWGPDVRLWPDARPSDECWSFDVRPALEVPALQRRLDDPAGSTREFVNVDVRYAHFVLRRDDRRRIEVEPDPARVARFADSESHVTERIDCLAVKLSHDLSDGDGANPVFRLGDGSQRVGHFAVLTRESVLNEDLSRAAYGDLLAVENGLLLWNDDEGAYNLVVDAETVVDRAGP
jgi:SAM-dependent methyltransferase